LIDSFLGLFARPSLNHRLFGSSAPSPGIACRKRKGANKKGRLEGKSTLPMTGKKKAAMREQRQVDKHNTKRRK